MKRGGNLLIPYASVTKIQQEQIERAGKWPEYTPEEPEVLNDEVSIWAIKFCKRMREIHDSNESVVDAYMPKELMQKSVVTSRKGNVVISSGEEEEDDEATPSENNLPSGDEENNDYVVDYFDEEADAFGGED